MEKTEAPATPDLEAPDLPVKESSIAQRWKENLTPTHADLVCLLLTFLTGLCDSSAYNAWSCFLGMQTGMDHSPLLSRQGGGGGGANAKTIISSLLTHESRNRQLRMPPQNRKHDLPRSRRFQST